MYFDISIYVFERVKTYIVLVRALSFIRSVGLISLFHKFNLIYDTFRKNVLYEVVLLFMFYNPDDSNA